MIQNDSKTANAYFAARATAAVAAALVALVTVLLLVEYAQRRWKDPFASPEYLALKQQLADPAIDQAKKDNLKVELRALDHSLRAEFFRQKRFALYGAHLLLAGAIVFLVAERTASALHRRMPHPEPADPSSTLQRRLTLARASRWAVAAVAVAVVLALAIPGADTPLPTTVDAGTSARSPGSAQSPGATAGLPGSAQSPGATSASPGSAQTPGATSASPASAQSPAASTPPADYPKDEEIARWWPRFRGPRADGVSTYTNLPTEWDATSGNNILWKTPVPLPGNNSPVVWDDRAFLAGADKKKREIYCFDTRSGKLLWTREAPSTPQSRAKVPKVEAATGFAAPTMTTDGRRAYAIFANGDVAAVDFAGNVAWSRSLGIPENNMYGYAASLALWRNLLFIQWDEGAPDDNQSKMISLDAATGKPVWQKPRPVANSWSSPIVVDHGGRTQLITASDPWIIAYDPADGRELWRAELIQGDHGITPVVVDGLLQVGNEYCEWFAIRPDGSGNVTETHVAWRGEDGLPDTVSPLVTDGLLLLTTSAGVLTCIDAAKGDMLWEHDFETEITSSPTAVGKRVYVFAKDGRGFIVEPTREECKTIAETNLGEPCVTSPAMQDGRIYIRTEKHLVCIGQAEDVTTKDTKSTKGSP